MNTCLYKQTPGFKSFIACVSCLMAIFALALLPCIASAADDFFLKSGDRVCFYGDSITEQRFYGVDVETFVLTRFPGLKVKFVNSGVGGDTVSGGWAGPIDLRLKRDVFPLKPNVVTIMLGMNDGKYRAFDEKIFADYTNGYEHIIQSLEEHLPGVKIVLIQPTPYDDVTYPPSFRGGYNAVLLRYAAFVRQLADEHNLQCVDFMTPLLEVMQKAQLQGANISRGVIPGRIHPSPGAELVMAQSLLQAWNAPSTVTDVAIDAGAAKATVLESDNTVVSDVTALGGKVSWTQQDGSLPFPILGLHEDWPQYPAFARHGGSLNFFWPAPPPKWDYTNTTNEAIIKLSGFCLALDEEPLRISGLGAGSYQLKINGQTIGTFSDQQLGQGIDLAGYHTPMLEQAYIVLALVWEQTQWRFFAWRDVQVVLTEDHDQKVQKASEKLISALEEQRQQIIEQEYAACQPQPMHYELVPAN
jgi:lysophospholipase L1-like esterase